MNSILIAVYGFILAKDIYLAWIIILQHCITKSFKRMHSRILIENVVFESMYESFLVILDDYSSFPKKFNFGGMGTFSESAIAIIRISLAISW